MTTVKKRTLVVVATIVLAVVESFILIFANFHYYAGTVNMYFLNITIPVLCMGYGWRWITQGRTKWVVWTNLCLMLIGPILFFFTTPSITYQQGEALISKQLGAISAKFVSKPFSVAVGKVHSHRQVYLYEVVTNKTTEPTYFTVNPKTGQVQHVKMSSNVS